MAEMDERCCRYADVVIASSNDLRARCRRFNPRAQNELVRLAARVNRYDFGDWRSLLNRDAARKIRDDAARSRFFSGNMLDAECS